MRHALYPLLALAIVACGIENDLGIEPPGYGVSNPPLIESPTKTDNIVQVTTPKVDVLWTIDNSCSMSEEQDALSENFPSFINYFIGSGLDFHVGVVSTDIDDPNQDGKLRTVAGVKYLDPETPSPTSVFTAMATMGTSGSGSEKGLGATYNALEIHRDTFNNGFYREDASMHTVVISDERDQTPGNLITQAEFVDWYDSLKDEADERSFSCIITMTGPNAGTAYKSTALTIGGIVWDITSPDWNDVLDQLGIQAAGLKREYFLSERPVVDSVVVRVLTPEGAEQAFDPAVLDSYGNLVDGDWLYDQSRNSITFVEFIPEALSTVQITYTLESSEQVVVE